ncbi:MAG: 16S rRNA (cytidine(1402)-2'-O)-methyltransferase [Gudongella sp.]|jgi:16S rRNA (cytidine1402-2'-O)-methyltransferase|nr:16S rRNA (cytidine(1402)-2'-O)-methyltransferase [Gudongella sp.]
MEAGKLYICPTPIGNLGDITLRTIEILKTADIIAAEDTRHTKILLNHLGIRKQLTSYHEHNIREKGELLIEILSNGKSVALVSDAGMPGISDPGEDLVRLAIESGIEVIGLPGASALITALVISGLPAARFAFEGFLPSKSSDRKKTLNTLKDEQRTIIFYESPHRIVETLADMEDILGDRKISLSRELTKKFEETIRGNLSDVLKEAQSRELKGEFVIVVEGAKIKKEDYDIESMLRELVAEGHTKKDAIKMVSEATGTPKNEVYAISLKIGK